MSVTLILVPVLFDKEKQKGNKQGLYQLKYWGAKIFLFYYHYYLFIYFIIKNLFIQLFFLLLLLCFCYNTSKAKDKVCKINIALIYLPNRLLPLFMKINTQSSLINFKHHVKF